MFADGSRAISCMGLELFGPQPVTYRGKATARMRNVLNLLGWLRPGWLEIPLITFEYCFKYFLK